MPARKSAASDEVKEWAENEAAMDEAEGSVDAGLVPVGTAYPEDFGHQRLQSVTSASRANDGGAAVDYETAARDVDIFERDGVQKHNDKKVFVKTFRIGIPAGAGLTPEQHESNMRQVVEDALKAGERVAAPVKLHSVADDEFNRNVLMVYVVELD
jgi:hypothetical protein